MKIQSLLNPLCSDLYDYRDSNSPTPTNIPRSFMTHTSTPKRKKIPKDAAVFTEGSKFKGPVNYPPHEAGDDEELATYHRQYQIHPVGEIGRYCRHIPYNSEKKDFMAKTGRESFEVFQYTFKKPGDDKEYLVLWDYEIGLVRITPFFKCCKYSKTTPAKVLKLNPGLRDISHSITGGSLAAQGYWMPFEAAKAVAATFCYPIRHALTPIFGKEFLSMCTLPKDPTFGKFLIDQSITNQCTAECERWRQESEDRQASVRDQSMLMDVPRSRTTYQPWTTKTFIHRQAKPADIESGYGTDTDQSDKYLFSPQVSPTSRGWTSINRSNSPGEIRSVPAFGSPKPLLYSVPSGVEEDQPRNKRGLSEISDESDDIVAHPVQSIEQPVDPEHNNLAAKATEREMNAAQLMLQLSMDDSALRGDHRAKRKRRAST
ncbi:DNA-binding domain of Mlu1-box binding protein MBP1 [Mytilinidion resinicola]|uniref:DNA-binding domain of Mlu1-box binding protein MBP1 n=1 Tax=Mytilinidion resinicola TaxID=574789 RepID=A0A6A6YV49_9PEZI|nr:DNA-binding domain of Mlu1-box binding protein MBP1 [Mytilinidion resinicola]KAF2812399.1 DNA-binding domain of Mlu1-box binding protein MBP1 [Mytilinidion resinicola]